MADAVRVSFGEFTIDVEARQLLRGNTVLHLSPKAFQLLMVLVRARPSVLDRATLRQHLWPDTHVVDAALGNLVAEIRGALGDAGAPFLRTVHGVGYAFSGDVLERGPRTDAVDGPRCWLVWNHRAIVLEQADNVIGRDPGCAVWIDAPGVSRRHARIQIRSTGGDADARLEDLGSTNGTYLRGTRLTQAALLHDGDEIALGEARLTFRAWRHGDAPTKRVRPPKPPKR